MISRSYIFLLVLSIAISPVSFADSPAADIKDSTENAVDMLLSDITSPATQSNDTGSKGNIIVPKTEQSFADTLNIHAQKMISSAEKAEKNVEKIKQKAQVTTQKVPQASDLITAKGNSIQVTPKVEEVEKATNDIKVITKSVSTKSQKTETPRAKMTDPHMKDPVSGTQQASNHTTTRSNTPETFDEGTQEVAIKEVTTTRAVGVGIERANGERLSAAMGHFARSHALLIQAIREFDRGRQIAKPDAVLDSQRWRSGLVQRTKDIQRVLAPQPRVSNAGVRYEPDSRLLRVTGN